VLAEREDSLGKRDSTDSPRNPSASEQHRRFVETARQLECDEDKERFEEKLKQIATAKPDRIAGAKSPKSGVPRRKTRK
jgi:hypothetical protein